MKPTEPHTIKYNSHRNNSLLGALIRFFSRGKYNHTSIELDGYVYEAHWKCGVRKTPVAEWINSTVKESIEFNTNIYKYISTKMFLEKQVGKRYDFFGVLSFVWWIFKEKKGKWFCSEYATVSLMKWLGLKDYDQRLSPHSFNILAKQFKQIQNDTLTLQRRSRHKNV